MTLYRKAVPVIRDGSSCRYGETGESWRHPRGWQAVVRVGADGESALVILHAFAAPPSCVSVPLPPGLAWRVEAQFATTEGAAGCDGCSLRWSPAGGFTAAVLLLTRE